MVSILHLLAAASAVAAHSCSISNIAAFLPTNSTVFFADHVEANSNFTPPATLNTGGRGGSFIMPRDGCVVQGNVSLPGNTQYSFGLVLPDDWKGRFLYVVQFASQNEYTNFDLLQYCW